MGAGCGGLVRRNEWRTGGEERRSSHRTELSLTLRGVRYTTDAELAFSTTELMEKYGGPSVVKKAGASTQNLSRSFATTTVPLNPPRRTPAMTSSIVPPMRSTCERINFFGCTRAAMAPSSSSDV